MSALFDCHSFVIFVILLSLGLFKRVTTTLIVQYQYIGTNEKYKLIYSVNAVYDNYCNQVK